MSFFMRPNDFGDVAAALWECSPTKQPITIMGTQTEGDTARRADATQLGIFEDPAKDCTSLGVTQGSDNEDREEATETGRGSTQEADARTNSGS